ncbi:MULTISPECIES: hypothetical protein [unclassified Streptomyces]|uniref:hypothetical protein n=1 Tax=unclassified Streptomyces TaxID=2593676 RepID=UPI00224DEEAF|nr:MULTISPECIES: hypothetical protein [unclassified Streptomyces]MCX4625367.1 hypothetical protein [Streptomyces sp. NBC_01443]WSW48970.1 hypothetical protein OG296_38525 [Streptomyces sp. NBC_01001]
MNKASGYFFEGELVLLDLVSEEHRNLFADDCRREARCRGVFVCSLIVTARATVMMTAIPQRRSPPIR